MSHSDEYEVFTDDDGQIHLRVDREGVAAVSTIITDAESLIQAVADAAGLDVEVIQ